MKRHMTWAAVLALIGVCVSVRAATPEARKTARMILEATGVQGGLVVHLGCGDGQLTAALRGGDRCVVHGLDRDPVRIEQARNTIRAMGIYGSVSVEQLHGNRLPYSDNLVNLILAEDVWEIPLSEVMRVLAPNGTLYMKLAGKWTAMVKPRSDELDEWTHYLHGPDNNAVANDGVVGPPHHLQWVGGPMWARSHDHLASISAMVLADKTLFLAGPPDIFKSETPAAALAGKKGGVLLAVSTTDGEILARQSLDSPPVMDGLVAASGRLYMATVEGQVVCMRGEP